MEKAKINAYVVLSFTIVMFFLMVVYVRADVEPTYPDTLTEESSGRWGGTGAISIEAEAGNITEITIDDRRTTQAWQGYYGNITGMITLDDASNYTMYDWSIPNPTGEIYASNGSGVTWADIMCVDFTSTTDSLNETILETYFGIGASELDGFSETFNTTYTDATGFDVGGVTINTGDSCHQAYTYVDEAYQTNSFKEVLLTDNVSIIFTALLENSADGFKTGSDLHDFQMLVAENGHPGYEATTTTYWFYVELA